MENLKQTCLHDRHIQLGAQMSPFAGWDMPIQYEGIEEEHNAVRNSCGVFDVSHMGEVMISGPDSDRFINHIFSNDVSGMEPGMIRYGMMLNEDGGVIDDLLVYKLHDESYFMVINASNIDKDVEWIFAHINGFDVKVVHTSDIAAEIAVQGPEAERVLKEVLNIDGSDLSFYTFKFIHIGISEYILSRTGYTGEDGFEIYGLNDTIPPLWDRLIGSGRCVPCGLGCRDTLRFEAGLPLYGDELDETISPIEAGLGIFVKTDKPEFIGRDAIMRQKAAGPARRLIGLELLGPGIARHGYPVLDQEGTQVGVVTTGYKSVTLGKSVAMALVDAPHAATGTELQVQIRRRTVPAVVVKKRFYTPNYKK